jgi:hypothetical protein
MKTHTIAYDLISKRELVKDCIELAKYGRALEVKLAITRERIAWVCDRWWFLFIHRDGKDILRSISAERNAK